MVILAPAAADIILRLGAGAGVVGVTNSVAEFPSASKLGTHLSPGIEKIASLRPSLIVATSRFNPDLASRMGAELFIYEPHSLDEIIAAVRALAHKLGREDEGERLASELEAVLAALVMPAMRPSVLYESRSNPLALGKSHTVVKDLLERAGMRYAYATATGAVSVEYLMAQQPDYYIYQQGPMNRSPVPPKSRPGWARFGSCVWKVNEFEFSRPNTRLFETVQALNGILNSPDVCARGREVYQE